MRWSRDLFFRLVTAVRMEVVYVQDSYWSDSGCCFRRAGNSKLRSSRACPGSRRRRSGDDIRGSDRLSLTGVDAADPEAIVELSCHDDRRCRANPSRLRYFFARVRSVVEQPTDRAILTALFASLFFLNYRTQLFDLAAGERLIFSTSRTVGGAEIIGFVAIAVVLKDLKADIVLRGLTSRRFSQ